jgi:hypothetical protein
MWLPSSPRKSKEVKNPLEIAGFLLPYDFLEIALAGQYVSIII